ncbi:hypothetical protein [Pseudomonas viridiflava]|uniref:hypothetical protein n=1 Tax=Pseudomonas viridiflava TaxID=33069 RepID=UPI002ECAB59F|nr:hypothetical protein [Pseudomonas viridiflava]
MFIHVADQGLGLILPTELQEFLAEVRALLDVAGGDGRINQIEVEAGSTLASFLREGKFDREDLGVVGRLMRAAISRKRSELDCDE